MHANFITSTTLHLFLRQQRYRRDVPVDTFLSNQVKIDHFRASFNPLPHPSLAFLEASNNSPNLGPNPLHLITRVLVTQLAISERATSKQKHRWVSVALDQVTHSTYPDENSLWFPTSLFIIRLEFFLSSP